MVVTTVVEVVAVVVKTWVVACVPNKVIQKKTIVNWSIFTAEGSNEKLFVDVVPSFAPTNSILFEF